MDQEEYFFVKAKLKISIELLNENKILPSMDDFLDEIPQHFRIANQCAKLDINAQKEFTGKNEANSVFTYLFAIQNEKINLLLGFILTNNDNEKNRIETDTFGASGLSFFSDAAFKKGQLVRLKIFMENPLTAVYCYGQISNCDFIGEKFNIKITYSLLQDEDRDVLIRAALHHQQKLLRQRAKARSKK